jgi:hypothetical protein
MLENLLIPIFLAVLIAAVLLEDASPDAVRRIALVFAGLLAAFLLFLFVGRYLRMRRR